MLLLTLAVIVGIIYVITYTVTLAVAGIRALYRKWKRDTGR